MERKKILLPIILYSSFLAALGILVLLTDKGSTELAINSNFNKSLVSFSDMRRILEMELCMRF
jgi:hypothetical protein